MPYGLIYRIKFTNVEGANINILIQDTTTFNLFDDGVIKDLTPSSQPLIIQVINSDEDKYSPIRSKSAIIKFLSDTGNNVSQFALNSTDNRWKVDIIIDNPSNPLFPGQNISVFTGFLVLNDMSEPLLDSTDHQEITLTASDGLGLLKDIPLTKPDGTNPKGKFTIIQYISWCLQKTGSKLEINVMNNLMEESFIGLPAYNNIKIDAKTFEDQINTCISCYDVLSKILGEECFLGQWKDSWWIKRIDEVEDNLNFYDNYTYDGIFGGATAGNVNFFKNIGLDEPIQLIVPATNILFERSYHHIQESFELQTPLETIDNIDFSRGTLISPLSLPADFSGYNVADWTIGVYLSSAIPSADSAIIIKKIVDGYEKERYLRLKQPDGQLYFVKSNPIPIDAKDKFSIAVDTRLSESLSGNGFRRAGVMQVRLSGYNGQNYFLHGPTSTNPSPKWILTNSTFSTNTDFVYIEQDLNDDETQWTTASCDAPPSPVDGDLQIWLINQGPDVGLPETHFQNLSYDYKPIINDSYQKYTSQYSKVYKTTVDLKAKRENQVYITDSPKKLFKGALFKTIAGKDLLTGKWVNGAIAALRTEPVAPQFKHPLGYIQAFSVWNQYLREMRMLDFNALGLDSRTEIPDMFHNIIFSDYSPHVYGKKFLLNYYEQDYYLCQWKGHLKEVFDFQRQKVYNDLFEFKYLEK